MIRPRAQLDWVRWLSRFTLNSRISTFNRGVEALLRLSSRTLADLDAMRADGVEFEMHSQGLMAVALSKHGLHWFDLTFAELAKLGFEGNPQRLSGDEARELEPAVSEHVTAAILSDSDRHVDPVSFMNGLRAAIEPRGVTVLEGRPVRSLSPVGGGWRVDADGLRLDAEKVVLATGMGTAGLVRPLGIRLPLIGAKGYAADVAGPEIGRALYLCEAKIGLSPMDDHTRVGGFFEIGATSARPNRRRALQLLTDTARYVRELPDRSPAGRRGARRPAAGDSRQPSLPRRTPARSGRDRGRRPRHARHHPGSRHRNRRGRTRLRPQPRLAPPLPPRPVNNGARHRYSAERTESTGGRCRAAVCQLWPPSTEPNSSPEVAPK